VVYEGGGDGTGNPGPSIGPFVPEVDEDDAVPLLTFGKHTLFPGTPFPLPPPPPLLNTLFSTVRRI